MTICICLYLDPGAIKRTIDRPARAELILGLEKQNISEKTAFDGLMSILRPLYD